MGRHHGLRLRRAAQQNNQTQAADQTFHAPLSSPLLFASPHKHKKAFPQKGLAALEA
jgi:hypothetical protein